MYYVDFLESVSTGKSFLSGSEVLFPIKGVETKFVLLNNIQKNLEKTQISFMSKCPIYRRIRWNSKNRELYELKEHVDFLNYKQSDLYKELQEITNSLPDEIQKIIKIRYVDTIEEVNIQTGRVLYTPVCIGKIWIPSVIEIYGRQFMSDARAIKEKQFDYFKTMKNRIMLYNGKPTEYWTRSVLPFHNSVMVVNSLGYTTQTCVSFVKDSVCCFQIEI